MGFPSSIETKFLGGLRGKIGGVITKDEAKGKYTMQVLDLTGEGQFVLYFPSGAAQEDNPVRAAAHTRPAIGNKHHRKS